MPHKKTPFTEEDDTPLWLLDPLLPADRYRKKLWGTVTVRPYKPNMTYATRNATTPIDLIDKPSAEDEIQRPDEPDYSDDSDDSKDEIDIPGTETSGESSKKPQKTKNKTKKNETKANANSNAQGKVHKKTNGDIKANGAKTKQAMITSTTEPLDVKPTVLNNYGEILKWSREGRIAGAVGSVLKGYLQGNETETEFRKATVAEWYDMEAPDDQLKQLLSDPEFSKCLRDYYEKHKDKNKRFYFVTSMLVVHKHEVRIQQGRSGGAGAGFKIPNPKDPTGLTDIVDADAEMKTDTSRMFATKFVEPQILAIGYYEIYLRVPDRSFGRKLLDMFKRKPPKERSIIGNLYDATDNHILAEVALGEKAARGNVKFAGEDDDDDDDHNDDHKDIKSPKSSPTTFTRKKGIPGIFSVNVPKDERDN